MALLAFCLKASCGTVITVSVRAGILSEGSTGKNQLPESLMWLLSGFSSLQVVGLGPQFLTGHGLEATLDLCHVGLSVGQLTAWQLAS